VQPLLLNGCTSAAMTPSLFTLIYALKYLQLRAPGQSHFRNRDGGLTTSPGNRNGLGKLESDDTFCRHGYVLIAGKNGTRSAGAGADNALSERDLGSERFKNRGAVGHGGSHKSIWWGKTLSANAIPGLCHFALILNY